MPQILQVATTTATDLLAYAGQLFTDLQSIIILTIGLPIGFWVITQMINLVSGRIADNKDMEMRLERATQNFYYKDKNKEDYDHRLDINGDDDEDQEEDY
jgi:hypothetical protein